jgi:hypothetical protein
MAQYVCLIFDGDKRVFRVETFGSLSEQEAREKAVGLSRTIAGASGHELWLGGRKISKAVAQSPNHWDTANTPPAANEDG